ncbi:Membrane-spanning 4-domains, subfamily A, member 19 [Apodemus speciosus]|uniref:Membrane-spanning 4-domains, subfamily A, member 19 n=1 Tax=Apodemus speciosus TaxID=105296 RepID=A0ABQ0FSI6_APOSI
MRGTYPHIPLFHLDEYATESSVDKKGTETVGEAIQLMTSLIIQSLGYFWTYLFFSQAIVFGLGSNYPPITGSSGYTLWASLLNLFNLSGSLSIILQKRPSNNMTDLDHDNEHSKHLCNTSWYVFNNSRTDNDFKFRIFPVAI